ncbi:hypothetical protein [Stenotrophomonas tuberculopleuritidis]|uniref:hypothetical protein n=1 Tax=Stenotrophomonas tuberculopleuritidis TaxID=3055079 RepID=UPI0026E52448|nr:hypothetical protein [Stenotrophomonas sp. 704A1]
MTTDNKTLADVKLGGRVRLGDQAEPSFNWKEGIHDETSLRLAGKAWDNLMYEDSAGEHTPAQYDQIGRMLVNIEQMMEGHPFIINEEDQYVAKPAALSAQPSPGGQGDALAIALEVFERRRADIPYEVYEQVKAVCAALAARQPVGALPQGCDACDQTGIRQNDEGRNICCPDCDLGRSCAGDTREQVRPSFQAGVAEWMGQCFQPSLYSDMTERGDRLLEEVLELLQARGYDSARVPTLVDYVFGRPVGEPAQEVGGVMVTLAGYCWVAGLDMHAAGDAELARINQPDVMAKIRAKQEAKNALHFDTPLPGNAHAPKAEAVDLPYSLDADPAGIRARVCDVITGTLMVGAQGYTPPPAGHWAEPLWQAAQADARMLQRTRDALRAAAKSLRTIANSNKDTEFLETAGGIRAYANSRASSAEQAVIDHHRCAYPENGS